MKSRIGIKSIAALIALLLLAALATNAIAASQLPTLRRYRDLKVYTTSALDKNQPERIVAQTQFVNEGPIPLRINARLDACQMNEDGKNVADRLPHFSKEIHDRLDKNTTKPSTSNTDSNRFVIAAFSRHENSHYCEKAICRHPYPLRRAHAPTH